MRKSIIVLICIGVAINNFQIEAITLKSRLKHMAGWAAATSVGWYAWQVADQDRYLPGFLTIRPTQLHWASDVHKKAVRGSLVPSVVAASLVGWISSYYTPEYRFNWAMSERTYLTKRILFSYAVTSENIKDISINSGAETTGLPLVTLFLELSHIDKTLGYLIDELEIASREICVHSELSLKIERLLYDLYKDRVRVRESSHTVKNFDKKAWQKQWEIHNANQMRERELATMQQIANTPQVHFQHHSKGTEGLATTMLGYVLTR